jgi:hypothetical protein
LKNFCVGCGGNSEVELTSRLDLVEQQLVESVLSDRFGDYRSAFKLFDFDRELLLASCGSNEAAGYP